MEASGPAFTIPQQDAFIPKIKIIGAGGGGGNVVSKMADEGIQHVELIACNTDLKALNNSNATIKMELGRELTRGLGAGARPEIGAHAAEESAAEIEQMLNGADMAFIVAGMGGGTGTGSAPVIARISKSKKILTVGVVTLPFSFEGKRRMRTALQGVATLRENTDTLLVIPNERLLEATDRSTSFKDAFHMVDEVLVHAIQGITDLLNGVGDINVDFADMQTVMEGMGRAVIGKGTGVGKDRMFRAIDSAVHSPLMQDTDIQGAKGILIHLVAPRDAGALEITAAMNQLEDLADEDVNLIWGATLTDTPEDQVSVTVIATGLPE
ncbi:MAG: cell division protein FtsZ [Deltaproteobacteria bacterium]|jgi:cell division protein FtsZ|nr:cell division protein FtsZ [Deltaproteobacteria bacterium]